MKSTIPFWFWRSTPRPLAKVGGLATMPSRASSLENCIDSIVSQVDRLYVYLDKYSEIPEILKNYPNVFPLLPAKVESLLGRTQNWGATGKFIATQLEGDCLYYTFDDDIIYPDDYSRRLGDVLAKYSYGVLVGVHGATFRAPYKSYTNDRHYVHFRFRLEHEITVDEIGTGTLAFRTSVFRPRIFEWSTMKILDMAVAIDAHDLGLPRVLVSRPQNYLQAVAEDQEDSLWTAQRRNESEHNKLMLQSSRLWEQRLIFKTEQNISSPCVDNPEHKSGTTMRTLSNEQIIKALYGSILGRKPDAGGSKNYDARLRAGATLEELIAEFVDSEEFKNKYLAVFRTKNST